MTEIAFHFNVPDKIGYACRLLRKAHLSGARVAVTGAEEQLTQLDTALWTFAPHEFIPHCRWDSAPELVTASAIVLAESLARAPHHDVVLNLGSEVPLGFERFERLIELVSSLVEDRHGARSRWRHYSERGYAIVQHNFAEKAQAA